MSESNPAYPIRFPSYHRSSLYLDHVNSPHPLVAEFERFLAAATQACMAIRQGEDADAAFGCYSVSNRATMFTATGVMATPQFDALTGDFDCRNDDITGRFLMVKGELLPGGTDTVWVMIAEPAIPERRLIPFMLERLIGHLFD